LRSPSGLAWVISGQLLGRASGEVELLVMQPAGSLLNEWSEFTLPPSRRPLCPVSAPGGLRDRGQGFGWLIRMERAEFAGRLAEAGDEPGILAEEMPASSTSSWRMPQGNMLQRLGDDPARTIQAASTLALLADHLSQPEVRAWPIDRRDRCHHDWADGSGA
jgi:hypothetical protein